MRMADAGIMSKHVMEALGMSRVTIEEGEVVEVTEPRVKYCPLFKKYQNIETIDMETVRENMGFRIRDFGMCTDRRETRMDSFLSFGISELLSMACRDGILDAAVIAADGCGTAILEDPCTIQGMGGRISAIIETSPSSKVIGDLGVERVLDPETAAIDQRAGAEKASQMGYSRFGVTTASAEDARFLRGRFGDRVMILGVHTTGIAREQAEMFFDNADIITSCASRWVRELAETRALLQAGTKVPVYAISEAGVDLMMARLKELGWEPDKGLTDSPYPLL